MKMEEVSLISHSKSLMKMKIQQTAFTYIKYLLAFPSKEAFLHTATFQKLTTVSTISNAAYSGSFFRHLNLKMKQKPKPPNPQLTSLPELEYPTSSSFHMTCHYLQVQHYAAAFKNFYKLLSGSTSFLIIPPEEKE